MTNLTQQLEKELLEKFEEIKSDLDEFEDDVEDLKSKGTELTTKYQTYKEILTKLGIEFKQRTEDEF